MVFNITDHLVTDDLTVLLVLIAATILLLRNLYKPQPLVHPILFGRQSDVARVRHPGESAVYRNYSTGLMGRFPLRPGKDVHLLSDLVTSDIPRTLWSTKITGVQLQQRASAFGSGLVRAANLVPKESSVLLLLDDSVEFLIADIALSLLSVPSATIASVSLLAPFLEAHPPTAIITNATFLPRLVELIDHSRGNNRYTVVVVGDSVNVDQAPMQVNVLRWTDIEKQGNATEKVPGPTSSKLDTSSQPSAYTGSSDVVTVAYFENTAGQLEGVQLTHENITAGVTAIRALIPVSNALSSLDTIASAFSLSTPFGRAIAYTALYEGASFTSAKLFDTAQETPKIDVSDVQRSPSPRTPCPTIFFIKPGHLNTLTSSILKHAKSNAVLHAFAWRHKHFALNEGAMTKESLWDRLVFDGARAKVMGEATDTLRAVIVSGGQLDESLLVPARIALSVPLVNAYTHPAVTGPVLASHPLDLQVFPSLGTDGFSTVAHVGPPSVNVEAKLMGVADEEIENGANPTGELYVRGPAVGKVASADESGWVGTGVGAQAYSNGTFKVL